MKTDNGLSFALLIVGLLIVITTIYSWDDNPPAPDNYNEVIAWMEEARDSHKGIADRNNPLFVKSDAEYFFHREWERRYNITLEVLEELR